ncbi:uncharacterized protein B0H18DRAFT_492451 [Fomitopsis serialis]|uniref:uncharacterized protein n=1 Tax=Fomitopsis serialis TaxID=139415 RepID=UPI0020088901|nr:uncharacterized protein B0H18DRAFT_492451 [Neoantrodia serialis]KAH9934911.1 hypothetical protein B0H18DRAFT_492451 [Neoantrodia serialis]
MSAVELEYVISMLDVGFVDNCCYTAACTIYTYDRCLTFWREVELLWRRPSMSTATRLYLLLHFSIAVYLYIGMILALFVTNLSALPHSLHGLACLRHQLSLRATRSRNLPVPVVEAAINVYEICSLTEVLVPQPVGCEITNGDNSAINRSCAENFH